jgi:hypothetical protein
LQSETKCISPAFFAFKSKTNRIHIDRAKNKKIPKFRFLILTNAEKRIEPFVKYQAFAITMLMIAVLSILSQSIVVGVEF